MFEKHQRIAQYVNSYLSTENCNCSDAVVKIAQQYAGDNKTTVLDEDKHPDFGRDEIQ